MQDIDDRELRACMAREQLTQSYVAKKMGVPVTTLNGWLRGRHPGPANLRLQLEAALGLAPGSLAPSNAEVAT